MATHVVPIELVKCTHQPGRKVLMSFSSAVGLCHVFDQLHGTSSKGSAFTVYVGEYEAEGTLTVGDVMNSDVGSSNLRFVCKPSETDLEISAIREAADCATKHAVNAFQVLMSKGRGYPDKKTQR
jgi:hypothetical protein